MKKDLRQRIADLILMLLIVCLSLIFVYFVATKVNRVDTLLADSLVDFYLGDLEYSGTESGSNSHPFSSLVEVKVDFINRDVLPEEDLIIFFDDNGNIFNTAYSDSDSCKVLIFPEKYDNCKCRSKIMDVTIELPEIDYDETWHITLDYEIKTYQVEVEKTGTERLGNKMSLFFQKFRQLIEKAAFSAKPTAVAEVNFVGADVLEEHDLIVFYDSAGNVFEIAYSDEGSKKLVIETTDLSDVRMSSNTLDAVIELPEITKDQSWEITFDYYTRSYNVKIIDQASIYETH